MEASSTARPSSNARWRRWPLIDMIIGIVGEWLCQLPPIDGPENPKIKEAAQRQRYAAAATKSSHVQSSCWKGGTAFRNFPKRSTADPLAARESWPPCAMHATSVPSCVYTFAWPKPRPCAVVGVSCTYRCHWLMSMSRYHHRMINRRERDARSGDAQTGTTRHRLQHDP